MAFKDITKVLYDGKYKLDYKDKAHRYYVRERANWDLPIEDPKAWGKIQYPKGTTTLLGDTLEKKGLMTWPLGLAMRELFGFYNFTNDEGEKMTGFSKDIGTLWEDGKLLHIDQETVLPIVKSASEAWQRKQKKGADIGSIVHDAIEHYIKEEPFDIHEQYNWAIKEAWPLPEPGEEDLWETERNKAFDEAPLDVEMATKAFLRFERWWLTVRPILHGAEDLLLSVSHKPLIVGTYDADLGVPIEHHPRPEMFKGKTHVRCTTDWKTSNASKSKEAAAPEGVYYSYFIQDAIYEMMRREMGLEPADDLLVVSARKDGEFSLIYASELGLTVDECLGWAEAVILCHRLMDKSKKALLAHGEESASKLNNDKEAF
jgi:hypothetical protein